MAFSSIRTSAGFKVTRDIRNAPKWASVQGSCSEILKDVSLLSRVIFYISDEMILAYVADVKRGRRRRNSGVSPSLLNDCHAC